MIIYRLKKVKIFVSACRRFSAKIIIGEALMLLQKRTEYDKIKYMNFNRVIK